MKVYIMKIVCDLHKLQKNSKLPQFDSVYLGGSFDSETDISGKSDIDVSLLYSVRRGHKSIQNQLSGQLEKWFRENQVSGNYEFMRQHCNVQFDQLHRKGILIKCLDTGLKFDLLIHFANQRPVDFQNFQGIKLLSSSKLNFQNQLQFYLGNLEMVGPETSVAGRLQVYFSMASAHFIKQQPEIVKQVIRRHKYWQYKCKCLEIERAQKEDEFKVTQRLPSIAVCLLVIHVYEKIDDDSITPEGLWRCVLQHLKDTSSNFPYKIWFSYFHEKLERFWPNSKNPLQIIDPSRPDRDIIIRLSSDQTWRALRTEARAEFQNNSDATSHVSPKFEYEQLHASQF